MGRFGKSTATKFQPSEFVSWFMGVNANDLQVLLAVAVDLGEALSFGSNKDHTGVCVTVFGPSGRETEWANSSEDLRVLVEKLLESYDTEEARAKVASAKKVRKAS